MVEIEVVDEPRGPGDPVAAWATTLADATQFGRTVSRTLVIGAWLAIVVGVGGSLASAWGYNEQGFDHGWWITIGQASYPFVIALLVAGLLATCSAYLRFQLLRTEWDLVDEAGDDEPQSDS